MVQLSSTFTAFHFARCRVLNVNFARYTPNMYLAFYWLAMANSCVNPLVYYWMNKRYSVHIIIINSLIYYWMKGIKLFILLAMVLVLLLFGVFSNLIRRCGLQSPFNHQFCLTCMSRTSFGKYIDSYH